MKATKLSTSLKLAAVTAAISLGGVAYAATGTAAASAPANGAEAAVTQTGPDASKKKDGMRKHKGEHRRHGHHRHGAMHDAAMWVPGYGPLSKSVVDTLDLSADQTKLLEEVQAEQRESRKTRHDAMKASRQARLDQIKAGNIDPKAALQASEKSQEQAIAARQEASKKWLTIWDALDDSQQQKVAAHFSERAEKFAQRAERRKAHKASHGKKDGQAAHTDQKSAES